MSSVMKNFFYFCLFVCCLVPNQSKCGWMLLDLGPFLMWCLLQFSWGFLIGSLQKKNIKKVLLQFLFTISIISWEINENLSVYYYTNGDIIFCTELL